ncbi:uncharacterized protein LOC108598741 [Drosophila busckii]|uniref:uncharacterized protein LOC108598741 n=1 Tax=Drosophila busckii TaxID=30019 RepID=UPI00083F306A|nr:uncharacterized protein LOC108598741 [Drosophila busckii]
MLKLQKFLWFLSLRNGCRIIALVEFALGAFGTYAVVGRYGFELLLESIVIISLSVACLLAFLLLIATLHDHESTGVVFTYLIWSIFLCVLLSVFYIMAFMRGVFNIYVLLGLLIGTLTVKIYFLLVAYSFMHLLVGNPSDESF